MCMCVTEGVCVGGERCRVDDNYAELKRISLVRCRTLSRNGENGEIGVGRWAGGNHNNTVTPASPLSLPPFWSGTLVLSPLQSSSAYFFPRDNCVLFFP